MLYFLKGRVASAVAATTMRGAAPAAAVVVLAAALAVAAVAASEVDENTFRKNELQTAVGHGDICCLSRVVVDQEVKGCGNLPSGCERGIRATIYPIV